MASKGGTKAVEAKTRKGRRHLESIAPQAVEHVKKLLLMLGHTSSAQLKDILVDLKHLRDSGECVHYTRKNQGVMPFEAGGETTLEFLTKKTDCGAFVVGSHSKKRPHNLVLGRVYDDKIFDLLEVGVVRYHAGLASKRVFSPKPCFVFSGSEFDGPPSSSAHAQLKNFFVDAFRGRVVDSINLKGIDRVIFFTCAPDNANVVLMRHYAIRLKRSGTRVPRVHLEDIGPSLDLRIRRRQEAPYDLYKEATPAIDAALRKKKEKNVTDSELDGAVGRVWLKPQDLQSLPLKKPKGRNRLPVEGKEGGEGKRKEGAEGRQAQAGGAKKRRKQRD